MVLLAGNFYLGLHDFAFDTRKLKLHLFYK